MIKVFISSIALHLSVSSLAIAAVTISYEFQSLRNSDDSIVPDGTAYALIAADSTNALPTPTDLLGIELTAGTIIGSKFNIFETGSTGNFGGLGGYASGVVSSLTYTGSGDGQLSAGRNYGIYWFPNLAEGDSVSANQVYGSFFSNTIDAASGGDSGTILPPDPSLNNVTVFYDADNTGTVPNSSFQASQTVIPEPSAALLGLLGAGALFLRRRR